MGSWQVSDLVSELQAMSALLKARGDTAGETPLAASLLQGSGWQAQGCKGAKCAWPHRVHAGL